MSGMARAAALCMGIGGLDLAVEAFYGCELAWCAEYDDGASSVIAQRWPGVPNLGDLTSIDWAGCELHDHPKVRKVDDLAAMGLWLMAGSWCGARGELGADRVRFDGPVVRLLWRSHRANARLRAELRRVRADLARAQDLCGASGDLIDKLTRERNEARLLNEWAGIQ